MEWEARVGPLFRFGGLRVGLRSGVGEVVVLGVWKHGVSGFDGDGEFHGGEASGGAGGLRGIIWKGRWRVNDGRWRGRKGWREADGARQAFRWADPFSCLPKSKGPAQTPGLSTGSS